MGPRIVRRLPIMLFVLVALAVAAMAPAVGAQKVELQLATWHWTEPGRADALRAIADAFTEKYPHITIKEISTPYPRYQDQMMISMAGGAAPDILVASDAMFFSFLDAGFLAPLDQLVDLERIKADAVDAQSVAAVDGQTYGVATEYVTYALLYNQKLFEEAGIESPPTSPEEFLEVAKKLTRAPDQYGYGTRHSLNEEGGWWYELSYWVEGFGGQWTTDGRPSVNTPEVVAGVKFFKEMYDAGIFPKGVDAATYRRMFAQEKVAMLTDNQAVYVVTEAQNPDIRLAAAPGPFASPVTNAEIVFYTIPEGAQHPEEAALFLEWFYDNLIEYGRAVQNVVGSQSANEQILEELPYLKTFVETPLADNGGILPRGYETQLPEFRHIVLRHVSNVLVNNADPQREMDLAQAELERL